MDNRMVGAYDYYAVCGMSKWVFFSFILHLIIQWHNKRPAEEKRANFFHFNHFDIKKKTPLKSASTPTPQTDRSGLLIQLIDQKALGHGGFALHQINTQSEAKKGNPKRKDPLHSN